MPCLRLVGNKKVKELAGSHDRDRFVIFWKMAEIAGYEVPSFGCQCTFKKSIVVRVNDRGPALDNRIVDLSYAAAKAVGLNGIGKVRLDSMREGDPELTQALLAQIKMPALSPIALPAFSQ